MSGHKTSLQQHIALCHFCSNTFGNTLQIFRHPSALQFIMSRCYLHTLYIQFRVMLQQLWKEIALYKSTTLFPLSQMVQIFYKWGQELGMRAIFLAHHAALLGKAQIRYLKIYGYYTIGFLRQKGFLRFRIDWCLYV